MNTAIIETTTVIGSTRANGRIATSRARVYLALGDDIGEIFSWLPREFFNRTEREQEPIWAGICKSVYAALDSGTAPDLDAIGREAARAIDLAREILSDPDFAALAQTLSEQNGVRS